MFQMMCATYYSLSGRKGGAGEADHSRKDEYRFDIFRGGAGEIFLSWPKTNTTGRRVCRASLLKTVKCEEWVLFEKITS